jgi:hypothetical protein
VGHGRHPHLRQPHQLHGPLHHRRLEKVFFFLPVISESIAQKVYIHRYIFVYIERNTISRSETVPSFFPIVSRADRLSCSCGNTPSWWSELNLRTQLSNHPLYKAETIVHALDMFTSCQRHKFTSIYLHTVCIWNM